MAWLDSELVTVDVSLGFRDNVLGDLDLAHFNGFQASFKGNRQVLKQIRRQTDLLQLFQEECNSSDTSDEHLLRLGVQLVVRAFIKHLFLLLSKRAPYKLTIDEEDELGIRRLSKEQRSSVRSCNRSTQTRPMD